MIHPKDAAAPTNATPAASGSSSRPPDAIDAVGNRTVQAISIAPEQPDAAQRVGPQRRIKRAHWRRRVHHGHGSPAQAAIVASDHDIVVRAFTSAGVPASKETPPGAMLKPVYRNTSPPSLLRARRTHRPAKAGRYCQCHSQSRRPFPNAVGILIAWRQPCHTLPLAFSPA